MTKSMDFLCGLSAKLHIMADAHFQLLAAEANYSSLSKNNHFFGNRYLGSELNAVVEAHVKTHCVKMKQSLGEETKANIDDKSAFNILVNNHGCGIPCDTQSVNKRYCSR